ncbi:hypothetical protein ACFFOU_05100 [Pseudonocardia sulfidoxydans]|nr:hypothetical protein [Pseudonocardia sulfidoxydans]
MADAQRTDPARPYGPGRIAGRVRVADEVVATATRVADGLAAD